MRAAGYNNSHNNSYNKYQGTILMKFITLLISAGLLVFSAAGQSTDTTKKSDTKKVTKVPDPPTIPKDATLLPDGSYRYVDKAGKKWIYRNTPFGVSKAEERPAPPVAQTADDPARSEDLGDSVRFTRPTPFGPKVWTKKKADMDAYEKTIFERDQQKSGHTESSVAAKPDGTASPNTPKQD
jgi:hypothetical protein